ncbi:unnamed protein product [Kuraishia capsulata CBS 1993]|uniref:WW domain-containing protein n=1 Tax=Kuraishia capsulata CBS 1993 TaxID=1382522 RepID=W6MK74_9ASCO|nr:uncharacterized protein KUCA_T00002370001 [Kuraishia capsulata CBS 1993]CDK26398.1 unnamed protein product [Kuraishia capsulata CBS 1993]
MSDQRLPPFWSSHQAQDGQVYFYNEQTQTSTYDRPVLEVANRKPKIKKMRRKSPLYGTPKFTMPLTEPWVLVITTTGNRFFHNTSTKQSTWTYPNKEVESFTREKMIVDEFLVLIAKARGLKLEKEEEEDEDEESEEEQGEEDRKDREAQDDSDVQNDFAADEIQNSDILSDQAGSTVGTSEPLRLSGQIPLTSTTPSRPLISGYDSSSDEEDPHEAPKQSSDENRASVESESSAVESMTDLPTDESGSEGGLNLSDLESDESVSAEDSETNKPGWTEFMAMLSSEGVDRFAPWELVAEQLIESPGFYAIADNRGRKACFDYWATEMGKNIAEDETESTFESPLASFVKFVKGSPKLFTYYAEFKRKFRTDPGFKALDIPDRERESQYRDLVKFLKSTDKTTVLATIVAGSSVVKAAVKRHEDVNLLIQGNYDEIVRDLNIGEFLDNRVEFIACDDIGVKQAGLVNGINEIVEVLKT